jgi:alpha-tubulin suppressor-like RCC1 family protein
MQCWGNNLWGNLCDGTVSGSVEPGPVLDLPGPIAYVAAGNAHTCAVTTTGLLYCCGGNANGELGNGTQDPIQLTPVQALNLSGVTAAAAGVAHTCAIAANGGVWCMGFNGDGELGNNSTNSTSIPVQVTGILTGATALATGDFHSCAVVGPQGTVSCWGSNSNGQLGNGKLTEANAPVTASKLPLVVSLAAGNAHTCALTGAGAVYCWGKGSNGQLGNQFVTGNQTTAVPVPNLASGVAGISANLDNSCAVTAAGEVYCWGDNTYGQLGNGTDAGQSNTPVQVLGLPPGMIAVTSSEYHSCAEAADGGIWCWGYDGYGELGDGQVVNSVVPVAVVFGPSDGGADGGAAAAAFTAISAGADNMLGLTASGEVSSWGNDLWGQLGNGTMETSLFPAPVEGFGGGITAISGGQLHGCALDASGTVWGWGDNRMGQLGNGNTTGSLVPVAATGLPGPATAIACGGDHSCAIVGGQLYCWGDGSTGELGNGQLSGSSLPVLVVNLSTATVAGVATAQAITCAWTAAGAAYCWGTDIDGLLGDNSMNQETVPTAVSGLTAGTTQMAIARVINNSSGEGHVCAVVAGALFCWGSNQYGELGNGQSGGVDQAETPGLVIGLDGGVTGVAVGANHSCALTNAGAVLCWGRGDFGSVGNASNASTSAPVPVIDGGALAITAGDLFSCATAGAQLLCWGYGDDGELGNGGLVNSNVPLVVQ